MISTLILATLLTLKDPANDAFGNGSLTPPTSVSHVSNALDIIEFSILKDPVLGFELTFSSLANPHNRQLGFSFPIVEIYIQDKDLSGGLQTLLPGSGMQLAKQARWHYALKFSGDEIQFYEAITGKAVLSPQVIRLSRNGTTLSLQTALQRPTNLTVFGLVGYYSPFTATGWQQLSQTPTAWSYSSTTQRFPVIDVIVAGDNAQEQALERGILPAIGSSTGPNYWTFVMITGLVLALFGVFMRYQNRQQEELDIPVVIKPPENPDFEAFLKSPNDTKTAQSTHTSKDSDKPRVSEQANPESPSKQEASSRLILSEIDHLVAHHYSDSKAVSKSLSDNTFQLLLADNSGQTDLENHQISDPQLSFNDDNAGDSNEESNSFKPPLSSEESLVDSYNTADLEDTVPEASQEAPPSNIIFPSDKDWLEHEDEIVWKPKESE